MYIYISMYTHTYMFHVTMMIQVIIVCYSIPYARCRSVDFATVEQACLGVLQRGTSRGAHVIYGVCVAQNDSAPPNTRVFARHVYRLCAMTPAPLRQP